MAAEVQRLEFSAAGFRELLHDPGIREALQTVAEQVRQDAAASAGLSPEDYNAEVYASTAQSNYKYAGRLIAVVSAATDAARESQASSKTLSLAAVQPRRL